MSVIINAPDTLRKAVESASGGKNTVVYTTKGQPCYMFVLPKYNVQDIDASLGTGVHPAFIVGGVEKSELLIGLYLGHELNGEMVSQPGKPPKVSINHDNAIALAQANGPGWNLISNAAWAAVALRCWKDGTQPRGNNSNGRDIAALDERGVQPNGRIVPTAGIGAATLTGSGPQSWRHDRTPFGISDLNGNVWEWTPGLRLNGGEINIVADNNAITLNGNPEMAVGAAAWRAIDGATGDLVDPGHANAVKVSASGTADYTLVVGSGAALEGMTNPGVNPVGATAMQRLRQLGIAPIDTNHGADGLWHNLSGERLAIRGGDWSHGARAGVFALYLSVGRTSAYTSIGARPAFVP